MMVVFKWKRWDWSLVHFTYLFINNHKIANLEQMIRSCNIVDINSLEYKFWIETIETTKEVVEK